MTFTIIASPIGLYRRKNDAMLMAQAEVEMGEVVVDGMPFKQNTTLCDAKVPAGIKEAWVVWSNAFSKDGSGVFYSKIDGVFATEEQADEIIDKASTGMQQVKGHCCEVVVAKKKMAIQ